MCYIVYPCCHEVYLVIISIHIRCEILHGHMMGVGEGEGMGGGGGVGGKGREWGRGRGWGERGGGANTLLNKLTAMLVF